MSGNKEAEIILEASKAIEEVSEVLNKSMKSKLKKNEEEEQQPEESLEKDGDNLVGEIPESSEPESDNLDSIIKGLSQSDLLNLASKALEALEGQGVPERSEDDIDAAEHEIKELKEDLPEAAEIIEEVDGIEMPQEAEIEAPEIEEEVESEEIAEDGASEADDLDSMLAGKELEDLNKFYKKLGEHIAARSEVTKSSKEDNSGEEPKKDSKKEVESAIAPAMAMIKNMQKEFKKSLSDSLAVISSKIDPLVSENKKLSHQLSEMKKSYVSLKKELDEIPSARYASVNAKAHDKLFAKSMFSAPESEGSIEDVRRSLVDSILAKQRVLAKSKNAPRVKFSEYVFKAEAATSISELNKIEKEIESFNIKL